MLMPLDTIIETAGNAKAVNIVKQVTEQREYQTKVFLVGPEGSGKTTIMRARQLDRDLLSTKSVVYRPCKELPEALRADVYDGYLEELGNCNVLLLDDFEGFWADDELGPLMCKLLLQERNRQGGDTIISSRKPLSDYDLGMFEGLFDDFVEVEIAPIEGEDLVSYIKTVQEQYRDETKSPVLSDEAIEYLAHGFDQTLETKRRAVYYLMLAYEGTPGEILSEQFVRAATEDILGELLSD